jgi:hypothetical protein
MVIVAITALFQACENDHYHYLDESTLPYFNRGDTLIYQSNKTEDTFCITNKYFYFAKEYAESHNCYQICDMAMHQLPIDFNNKPTGEIPAPNDSLIFIRRLGYTAEITWHHFNESTRITDSTITYIIGNHKISNVFKLVSKDDSNLVVYYNYNYGIIAYNFGELFEMKERYLDRK